MDADLGVCRLIRKAGIALELLELPAIEFIDMFAVEVRLRSSFPHRGRKHIQTLRPIGSIQMLARRRRCLVF